MKHIFAALLAICCVAHMTALPAKLSPFHTTFNGDIYLFRAGINYPLMEYYLRALNLNYQLLCERGDDAQPHDVERCFEGNLYTALYRCHSNIQDVELLAIRAEGKCTIDNEVISVQEAWTGKTKKNFDEIDKTSATFGHLNQLI